MLPSTLRLGSVTGRGPLYSPRTETVGLGVVYRRSRVRRGSPAVPSVGVVVVGHGNSRRRHRREPSLSPPVRPLLIGDLSFKFTGLSNIFHLVEDGERFRTLSDIRKERITSCFWKSRVGVLDFVIKYSHWNWRTPGLPSRLS